MASIQTTISGVTISQAQLLAEKEFGRSRILKMEYNINVGTYDVYVIAPIDKAKAKIFKMDWDKAFRIIPARIEDASILIEDRVNVECNKKAPSTIKGLTCSIVKRMAKNTFGEDILKIDQNISIPSHDVYVSSLADKKKLSEFKEKWDDRIRVITVILEPAI